jgi:hypothetical protein
MDEPNHPPAFHWKCPGPTSGLLDMVIAFRPFVQWTLEICGITTKLISGGARTQMYRWTRAAV